MLTGPNARFRVASISSLVALFGILAAGCGDDIPAQQDGGTGGSGGSGGKGGDAGVDRTDADAKVDGAETGDLPTDRGEAGGDLPTETPEVARACYMVSFQQPTDLTTLSAANDKDADQCANGFQYDVIINSTDAPAGTVVNLLGGNVMLASTTVMAGKATFSGVTLASSGDTALSIQFPSTMPCTDPTTKAKVTVTCKVPACTISKPSHTTLNGIPVAQGGDRVSTVGSPYQVAFEVTTDIEDGRPVALKIDNAATPATVSTVMGTAMGGKATFSGVTLTPDAKYEVIATCTDKNNVVGSSMKATFTVDTTPPDLTVSKPKNGDFFGPADLTAGKFKVCGNTTATDAVNIPPGQGTLATNFCITGTNNCVAVTAVGTDACLDLACPGGAPFDISVNLNDAAGNIVTKTVTGVSCASTLPSVRIVAPVSDAPTFSDKTKRLLSAAAAGAGQLKDLDANAAGAQANVSACSDRAGMAQLLVGHAGDATLSALGSAVATVAAGVGECPAGFGFIAKFNGVTLPESTENASGALTAATELRVDLTDVSTAKGSSAVADIWVDTVAPVVSLKTPANLCGSFQQSAATFMSDVALNSDTATVTLTVTNGASTDTRSNPTVAAGVATFTAVNFDQGQNSVAAVATDAAGNTTTLAPAPCTVTVGGAPVVGFTKPLMTQSLCPNGSVAANCIADNDAGTPGWQGSITVHVTVGAVPLGSTNVTFTIGATTLGTALLDVNGNATLAITTNVVPEGSAVTFTATTDNVPAHGVGTGTVTVNVDTLPPDAPTGLAVAVLDRRLVSFRLSWTAPDDHGRTVDGYEVRVAVVPIDITNFNNAAITQVVPFTSVPVASPNLESAVASGLFIEQGYYFAVAAKDKAGNISTIVSTASTTASHFLTTVLSGTGTDGVGHSVDGSGDFGRPAGSLFTVDGMSDIVTGAVGGKNVYIFFGTPTGYAAAPSVTINFPSSTAATILNVANAGDLDGDQLDDIAISSSTESKVWIYSRKNPPVSWGTTTSWPAMLTDAQANYTITAGGAFAGNLSTRPLARVGNFDGTGSDDLVIGFSLLPANTKQGAVVIVKGSSAFASRTLPDPVNTIEIDGIAINTLFGSGLLGIGQFYPAAVGATLVIGAPTVGTLYAFPGQAPLGILTASNAAQSMTTSITASMTLGFLGPLGGSPGAVAVGSFASKFVDVHLGASAVGPFQLAGGTPNPTVHFIDTAAGNSFGIINLGGGVKGTSGSVSFIGGDNTPDLVLAGQGEAGNAVYVVSGSAIPSMTGTVDLASVPGAIAPSAIKILNQIPQTPATWGGFTVGSLIVDSNGDGFGDFVLGENGNTKPGRVVVFY
jgi:hypothetical protein